MTSDFNYITYIKSTPEKVWQAITVPEFARQYWGMDNISDWRQGSEWRHVTTDGTDKIIGKVLESNPPTRLVLSWASPDRKEAVSQVIFEITKVEDMVCLTVAHNQLDEEMARGVTYGWPRVLSSLKSFLETGTALDTWAAQEVKCS